MDLGRIIFPATICAFEVRDKIHEESQPTGRNSSRAYEKCKIPSLLKMEESKFFTAKFLWLDNGVGSYTVTPCSITCRNSCD